jgi:hypothetical protein
LWQSWFNCADLCLKGILLKGGHILDALASCQQNINGRKTCLLIYCFSLLPPLISFWFDSKKELFQLIQWSRFFSLVSSLYACRVIPTSQFELFLIALPYLIYLVAPLDVSLFGSNRWKILCVLGVFLISEGFCKYQSKCNWVEGGSRVKQSLFKEWSEVDGFSSCSNGILHVYATYRDFLNKFWNFITGGGLVMVGRY